MTKTCGARLCIPGLARQFFRHSAVLSLTAVLLHKLPIIITLERFSFECQKVAGFALSTLHDWLKRFAPLFHLIRSQVKPEPIVTRSHAFSRALRQLHVISSSLDWFTVLSAFFVIG